MSSEVSTPARRRAPRGSGSRGAEARLAAFRERLDREIGRWLEEKRASLAVEAPLSSEITGVLGEYVLRAGKRIRPALLYYAYLGCGGGDPRAVLPAAMSLELLHSYLLIHDDIMDRATTRRGGLTAHLVFRDHHRASRFLGDSVRHGESVAVLLGDLAHSCAVELFFSTPPEMGRWDEARASFTEMCQEVVIGQYLEMTAPSRDLDEEALLTVLRLKSGRYSVERPIRIGALLAGADDGTLAALGRYGRVMGEAFQLQDDLLGVFGDGGRTGKSADSDLAEGKFTVLVRHALDAAPADERAAIVACLRADHPGPDEIAAVREIIERVGARRQVERMVAERVDAARHALSRLGLESEGASFFDGLIDFLQERDL